MATFSVVEYGARLKRLRKDLNKAVQKPFRVHQKKMQGELIAAYWDHRLGGIIWRWRKKKWGVKGGPSVKLSAAGGKRPKRARWSRSEAAWIAPITVQGMAAAIEGEPPGKTESHVPWGRMQHRTEPGVALPRMNVLERIVDAGWLRALDEIEREFANLVKRTF